MSLRLIDITIHDMSCTQAVVVLLNHFAKSTSEPVTLMTRRGQMKDTIAKMRTELTRYRDRNPGAINLGGQDYIYFGFSVVTEIPLEFRTEHGFRDAVAIYFHVTPTQNIKNIVALEPMEKFA